MIRVQSYPIDYTCTIYRTLARLASRRVASVPDLSVPSASQVLRSLCLLRAIDIVLKSYNPVSQTPSEDLHKAECFHSLDWIFLKKKSFLPKLLERMDDKHPATPTFAISGEERNAPITLSCPLSGGDPGGRSSGDG